MLDAGEVIVPGFRQTRALHAWTGARPLFHDERASEDEADTRHMSRGLAVVDHRAPRRRVRLPHHHRRQADHATG